MMSSVGVCVTGNEIALVVMRRQSVLLSRRAMIEPEAAIDVALRSLLSDLRRVRFSTRVAAVALGPHYMRLRAVEGIPAGASDGAASAVLAHQPGRFLLQEGAPLLLAARVAPEGETAFTATAREALVTQLESILREKRLVLRLVLPTSLAHWLARGRPPTLVEVERRFISTLAFDRAGLVDVRVARHNGADSALSADSESAGSTPDRFDAFEAAVGAVRALRETCLPVIRLARKTEPWRIRLAVAGVLMSAITMTTLPLLIEFGRLALLQRSAMIRPDLLQEYRRLNDSAVVLRRSLDRIATFGKANFSALQRMEFVSRALPRGASITSLHLDSTGATIAVVGRSLGAAVGSLSQSAVVAVAELTGPIVQETRGDSAFQRSTVRIEFRDSPRSGHPPAEVRRARAAARPQSE